MFSLYFTLSINSCKTSGYGECLQFVKLSTNIDAVCLQQCSMVIETKNEQPSYITL